MENAPNTTELKFNPLDIKDKLLKLPFREDTESLKPGELEQSTSELADEGDVIAKILGTEQGIEKDPRKRTERIALVNLREPLKNTTQSRLHF